jgi:copper chaperone
MASAHSAATCACCAPHSQADPVATGTGGQRHNHQEEPTMTTATYHVTGMTCGHCVGAVTGELKDLDGVSAVAVELNAGGPSTVTVTSAAPLSPDQVSAALEEAGGYQLIAYGAISPSDRAGADTP